MRVLLLCSAFNGLSQRAWLELRRRGHDVSIQLAVSEEAITSAVERLDPDLIICPFLRERVPAAVWTRYRTIIVHPGPKGDRGPSSLDWAIIEGERRWGVTALQAVEEMDAGPVWATRTFPLGADPPAKSALYNGPVADAAIELIGEVVDKAADPAFRPEPLDERAPDVIGRLRPTMRQADRLVRLDRQHGDDRAPHPRRPTGRRACARRCAAWRCRSSTPMPARRSPVSRARSSAGTTTPCSCARATAASGSARSAPPRRVSSCPRPPHSAAPPAGHPCCSHCTSTSITPAAGRSATAAMATSASSTSTPTTGRCRPACAADLTNALRHAVQQPTKVLLIRGGDVFSNGIHLNVIQAAASPALEAWRNINAIDDACREIITCTSQLVVASMRGNAGAGGVMLALGADRVVARDGIVLNPHYATMGLYGSEYWTYVLPRRVGETEAAVLTGECLPIDAAAAGRIGLVDDVLRVDGR